MITDAQFQHAMTCPLSDFSVVFSNSQPNYEPPNVRFWIFLGSAVVPAPNGKVRPADLYYSPHRRGEVGVKWSNATTDFSRNELLACQNIANAPYLYIALVIASRLVMEHHEFKHDAERKSQFSAPPSE